MHLSSPLLKPAAVMFRLRSIKGLSLKNRICHNGEAPSSIADTVYSKTIKAYKDKDKHSKVFSICVHAPYSLASWVCFSKPQRFSVFATGRITCLLYLCVSVLNDFLARFRVCRETRALLCLLPQVNQRFVVRCCACRVRGQQMPSPRPLL